MPHRGGTRTELDVDSVLTRHPEVVVVDQLAHTNAPGSRNPGRWQNVDEILAAGIDVLATVDVQDLESLPGVVEQLTGTSRQETVPDAVGRRADRIELVDTTPDALLRHRAGHPLDSVRESRERVVVALTCDRTAPPARLVLR